MLCLNISLKKYGKHKILGDFSGSKFMKALLIAIFLFINIALFSSSSGDYREVTVKNDQSLKTFVKKELKKSQFKNDLLRYNNLKEEDFKPGLKIKIPYSISKDRAAKVRFVKGSVKRKSNGKWTMIRRAGTVLLQNDLIKTGKSSKVEIQFDDGSLLQLTSDSQLSLKEYAYSKNGRKSNLNLKNGAIFANVNKLRKRSQFKVTTVTAVAGVRGTEFFVSLDKNKNMKVEVYKGRVDVSSKGKTVVVKKGYETEVKNGESPNDPKKLKNLRKVDWE